MGRLDILRAWDAEVEEEWISLIHATTDVLDRLAEEGSRPADLKGFRALHERTLAVGRRRGELWRQIAELEGEL
ncbi:MAG: hypothetical protein AB7E81_11800 [Hyphomicrobiaceae bacterium]|jgi:hypothetical protein